MYSINFAVARKKIYLSLHYNGENSYLFVNGTAIYKFKAKDCEIAVGPIFLANISKYWLVNNTKRTGFIMILVLIIILFQLTILKIFISN